MPPKDKVDKLIICNPTYVAKKSGAKTDFRDALHLAQELRTNHLQPVFHDTSHWMEIRTTVSGYLDIVEEIVRFKNRLMVALEPYKTIDFSSTKIQMISRVQYLPLAKQENFLRAKYETEGLSPKEIADITFSSRSTIVKYLETHGIALRVEDRFCGTLPYGKRWKQRQIVINTREHDAICKAKDLRSQGLSFDKIASVMNTMGVKTKTGRAKWYAKTIRDILIRNS